MSSLNLEQLYAEIANGDSEAYNFIIAWGYHCNIVDDIIDLNISEPEKLIKAFVNAQNLMNQAFYKKYSQILWPQLLLAANAYLDHLTWNSSTINFKANIADLLRGYPNEMLLLVAMLTSKEDEQPYERMRKISLQLRELSYINHHDSNGNPI